MNVKQAAQTIRDTVDMGNILSLYGYAPKRGVMPCPFHGERNPSLKIYPETGGWHCFGCGRGGSVIDFVMEHENCDFTTAVRAIDGSLRLGLFDRHENPEAARKELIRQQWLDRVVSAMNAYLDALEENIWREQKTRLVMLRIMEDKRDRDPQSMTADDWQAINCWKDYEDFDEYRLDKIKETREEVAAWRRKHRGKAT